MFTLLFHQIDDEGSFSMARRIRFVIVMFALLYAAAFGGFGPGVGSAFAFGLVTSAMT